MSKPVKVDSKEDLDVLARGAVLAVGLATVFARDDAGLEQVGVKRPAVGIVLPDGQRRILILGEGSWLLDAFDEIHVTELSNEEPS